MHNSAKWLTHPECPADAAPVFRKRFSFTKRDCEVNINICGVGFYTFLINGKQVSDDLLSPPVSPYDRVVYYQTYDISEFLLDGENEISVTLGNGMFNETVGNAWNFNFAPWRSNPCFICEILCGEELILGTDTSWECAVSKTVFNGLRTGETYDSTAQQNWIGAAVALSPGGKLVKQASPSVKLREELPTVSINKEYNVYDFGVNTTGNAKITVRGQRGAKVTLLYSERVFENGDIDRARISKYVFDERFAQEEYILSGEGNEVWCSSFTYHGFRYIKVIVEGDAEIIDITARGFNTELPVISNYTTDNELINRFHKAAMRSTLTNFVHVPLDCPHREKNGWTGDALLSSEQTLFNLDIVDAYIRWLDDIVALQRPNGAIPCIIPCGVWGFGWGTGPTWDAVLAGIVWNIYLFTGRRDVLERYFEPIKKYLGFLSTTGDNNIWRFGLGDWCVGNKEKECDTHMLLTAYAYNIVSIFADIASVLGKTEDETVSRQWAKEIRQAFIKEFAGKDAPSQTHYAMMLYFGLTDEKQIVVEKLNQQFIADDYHIVAGIFGLLFIPEVMTQNGLFELVWRGITQKTHPSIHTMMNYCSGTLGEHWDGEASQNHHMFSQLDAFVYRWVVGVSLDKQNPGFKHVFLKPQFPKDMHNLSAQIKTPYGYINVSWDDESYNVELPNGITATLTLNGSDYEISGKNTFER